MYYNDDWQVKHHPSFTPRFASFLSSPFKPNKSALAVLYTSGRSSGNSSVVQITVGGQKHPTVENHGRVLVKDCLGQHTNEVDEETSTCER